MTKTANEIDAHLNTLRAWDGFNPIDPKSGKPATSEAGRLRAQRLDRVRAIAACGWEPEPEICPPGERWAYSTEELWSIARESLMRQAGLA